MNIAVFGATGPTGRLVVEHVLAKGHRVTAPVRNPDSVSLKHAWIAVRLAATAEGPAKPVRTTEDGKGLGFTITASSLAEFLLTRAAGPAFLRQTPSISN